MSTAAEGEARDEAPEAPQAPDAGAKVDPETLALRARPPRTIRFRKPVIIGGTVGARVLLAVAGWMALEPGAIQLAPAQREPDSKGANGSDTLAGLPHSYGDVPQLGEPLPGDLGRPILRKQAQLAQEQLSDGPGDQARDADRQLEEARQAREQAAADQRAARTSGLIASAATREGASALPPVAQGKAMPASSADPTEETEPAGRTQDAKSLFLADVDKGPDINPHNVQAAASPYVLSAGSVISASLSTGLRSDLPGLVVAQVTERVYDSATGQILLVPQGARLIGRYDNVVAFGQSRALIAWQRIVFPDGRSIRLDNAPATDAAGYAGLEDRVDFHSWQLLKGIAASTLLGVGANLSFDGESDLVRALRESAQTSSARAGDQLTSRNLSIQPTITIRPGAPVRLLVHRDLILSPWQEGTPAP
ncbi:TrbI/VirB10 family protein [Sphingobium yanoikuyae]|uniref:TrbI/VirB10 family protein n=1 Tax=Sphingobium yanoikuyae TaxID=13690 RepID=UPI003F0F673E